MRLSFGRQIADDLLQIAQSFVHRRSGNRARLDRDDAHSKGVHLQPQRVADFGKRDLLALSRPPNGMATLTPTDVMFTIRPRAFLSRRDNAWVTAIWPKKLMSNICRRSFIERIFKRTHHADSGDVHQAIQAAAAACDSICSAAAAMDASFSRSINTG